MKNGCLSGIASSYTILSEHALSPGRDYSKRDYPNFPEEYL